MIADTAIVTRETCDRCGPSVYAAATVTTVSGLPLTFCGHDVRYVIPATLAATAVALESIGQDTAESEAVTETVNA